MRPAFKFIVPAIAFGVIISISVGIKVLLDANDYIDRCADETSRRYLFDKEARVTACK